MLRNLNLGCGGTVESKGWESLKEAICGIICEKILMVVFVKFLCFMVKGGISDR